MSKRYVVDVQEDEEGELFIQFPDEMMTEVGWKTGDILDWKDNKDGSWSLSKKETEWVLVETVSTFRERYMVEVPKGKAEWALDTVTCEDAKEFSQEHIGEQIISHRVVTREEALTLCDKDNDYTKTWDEETKVKNFFTPWTEDYFE